MAIPYCPQLSPYKACLLAVITFGHDPKAICQHQQFVMDVRLTWAAPEPCNAIMSSPLPYRHPPWRFCQPPAALERQLAASLLLDPVLSLSSHTRGRTETKGRARGLACVILAE
jgi:hypothetical protein